MDFAQLMNRLRSMRSAFTTTQAVTLGAAFVLVVGLVIGSAYWLNAPSYRLLYSEMDAEAASDVVSRLEALGVPYQIGDGGRSVRVPADRLDELRLDFAGQGMPSSGRVGFEIFDRTVFGATDFLEQVNYRRALEGEIARTISTLSEVSGARVHIAMAKDSLFGERQQPAKASVVLKLRNPNRPLAASSIRGIASLVAASVEGLRPEAVVIMDGHGRPLSRTAGEEGELLDAVHLERQARIERDLGTRIIDLLEPVFGRDRVRVNVSARLKLHTEEVTEELWDPATVVRSRQTTTDVGGGFPAAIGLAGARANLPPPVPRTAAATDAGEGAAEEASGAEGNAPANTTTAAGVPAVVQAERPAAFSVVGGSNPPPMRSAETTNYEVNRTVRHTMRPQGEIARLSVAVLIDNEHVPAEGGAAGAGRESRPRTPEEMQKVYSLVAAGVGLDTERGDLLTVENIPFDESPEVEDVTPPAWWQRYAPQLIDAARIAVVLLLGVLSLFFVIRPMVRRGLSATRTALPPSGLPQQLPRTVEELQGELEAQLGAADASLEPRKISALTRKLTTITQKEPENAARLIRAWLTEEGGE